MMNGANSAGSIVTGATRQSQDPGQFNLGRYVLCWPQAQDESGSCRRSRDEE